MRFFYTHFLFWDMSGENTSSEMTISVFVEYKNENNKRYEAFFENLVLWGPTFIMSYYSGFQSQVC